MKAVWYLQVCTEFATIRRWQIPALLVNLLSSLFFPAGIRAYLKLSSSQG